MLFVFRRGVLEEILNLIESVSEGFPSYFLLIYQAFSEINRYNHPYQIIFKNCEVPIICYKYNKPIRGAIFNFNKLVSDLDIETCTPDS